MTKCASKVPLSDSGIQIEKDSSHYLDSLEQDMKKEKHRHTEKNIWTPPLKKHWQVKPCYLHLRPYLNSFTKFVGSGPYAHQWQQRREYHQK